MRVPKLELEKRGWEVVLDGLGGYKIQNGDWDYIFGFKDSESAWSWLQKVGEPRPEKYVDPNPIIWIG